MALTRRQFLGTAAALTTPAALAGCGGFSTSRSTSNGDDNALTFTTWGTDSELAGFRQAIDRFQQANSASTVNLNGVPYEQMFTNIDAQIQAGHALDVFRVPYYTFGGYAGRGQLLDLTPLAEVATGRATRSNNACNGSAPSRALAWKIADLLGSTYVSCHPDTHANPSLNCDSTSS